MHGQTYIKYITLFLKVFSLHGKDASKPAGNWFQVLLYENARYRKHKNLRKHIHIQLGILNYYTNHCTYIKFITFTH